MRKNYTYEKLIAEGDFLKFTLSNLGSHLDDNFETFSFDINATSSHDSFTGKIKVEIIEEGIELSPELYDSLIDLRTVNSGVDYSLEGTLKVAIMPKKMETDSIYGVYVGFQAGRDVWTEGEVSFTVKYSMTADGENFVTENIEVSGQDYSDFRVYPKNLNGLILEFDIPKAIVVKIARDQ